jgi:hypothetical protein
MSFFVEHTEATDDERAIAAMVTALHAVETYQSQLRDAERTRQHLLRSNANLRQVWDRFMQAGGISCADFDQFVQGRFRNRRVHKRRHLRLV